MTSLSLVVWWKERQPMAIPQHLDTFYLGDRIVTPQIIIDKRTMQPIIYVRVTAAISGSTIEVKVVRDENAYLEYVESLIGR
jgi:hypothetical protein